MDNGEIIIGMNGVSPLEDQWMPLDATGCHWMAHRKVWTSSMED